MIMKASLKRENLILPVVVLLAFTFPLNSFGQSIKKDSTKTLSRFLKEGDLDFKSRTFFMSTINEGSNRDYFALANGIGVDYTTPNFRGFNFKIGGYFTFRLAEYNLVDSETNEWTKNRYEKALYDINNPNNKYNLGSLEEVYLSYSFKGFNIKLGRQIHQTPLLNKNTNRMRPNLFQGLNANYEFKNIKLSAAWFISEAVRATMNTYSIGNSYGVYGEGRNADGSKNAYHGHINSLGIGVFGIQHKTGNWETQAYNYLAENAFNLAFIQSDYKLMRSKTEFNFGVQGFYQNAINNGGNKDPKHTYMFKGEQTFAIGGMLGLKLNSSHDISLNYMGISDQGRYLFPREWGREIFYASQSREVFEGYGGVNAYVFKYKYSPKTKSYSVLFGAGIIDQPNIDIMQLNKYALDDYYHFTVDLKYKFQNYFDGMSFRFLAAYKKEMHSGSMSTSERLNKVNMINLNLVIDYKL